MSKVCWLVLLSWLVLDVTVGSESTANRTIYYKQSISTAAEPKPVSKENVRMTMEGQTQIVNTKVLKKKTFPRKGVESDKSIESPDNNSTLNDPPVIDQVKKTNSTVVTKPNKQTILNSTEIKSTENPINQHIAPVKEEPQEKPELVPSSSTTRTPKPKPTLTIGGKEADGPIPASPTDKSPIIMPRKMDYIVPVIITFTALPLLGVTFYVLYKRGKDYWSKRHYRRMDFLIDGMYNE